MTDAIKPCPFCGHRAKVIELEHAYWNAKIKCTFCHVQTDLYNLEQHKEAMIADWNRRTPPAGWKLVPIEPTEAMFDCIGNRCNDFDELRFWRGDFGNFSYTWRQILAAAPENET